MSKLLFLTIAFATLAAVGGCPFPLYELTVSVSGDGSVDSEGGAFVAGTTIRLTATPDEGWRFEHWEGDVWETDATVELTLESDLNVRAIFVQVHELSVSVDGSGSVAPSAGTFDGGSLVPLTATPDEGWRFDSWEGDVLGTDETIEVTLDSDLGVLAVFVQVHELVVPIEGKGSVEPDGGVFDAGSEVTLSAVPAEGWLFGSWSGDVSGTDPEVTAVVDGDMRVSARFVAVEGRRSIRVDGWPGSMTLAVAGAELRGVYRVGNIACEVQGTISARQVTLTLLAEGIEAATVSATIDAYGAWLGTIDGSGYENDDFTSDPVVLTGCDHLSAGFRTITLTNDDEVLPGKMMLVVDGGNVQGNAILGFLFGVDVAGSIWEDEMRLTISSPGCRPATLDATLDSDGSLAGSVSGSGLDHEFYGDPPIFP